MNISSLNNLRFSSPFTSGRNYENNSKKSHFGLKMSEPIKSDTVSFKAITPKLKPKTGGRINRWDEMVLENYYQSQQAIIDRFMKVHFGDLVATIVEPNKPIEYITGRSKKRIAEKAASRDWSGIQEIMENMTDGNGEKFVLKYVDRNFVDSVIDRIITLVNSKDLEVLEIENKRPAVTNELRKSLRSKYDYASPSKLIELQDTANKMQNTKIEVENDPQKSNYTAIHLICKLKNMDTPFELQIMGHDVARYKDLDDLFFKILNNKEINPMYGRFKERIEFLMKPENKDMLDAFNQYRADCFLFQRQGKNVHNPKSRKKETFLNLNQNLPDSYSMEELYKLKRKCEYEAKKLNKENS